METPLLFSIDNFGMQIIIDIIEVTIL